MENYGRTNLRPSTFAGYQNPIIKHILPDLGKVPLSQLSPVMLDHLFQKLLERGLSAGTVKGTYRTLNVSLEHARKYHYIEHNPVKDVITTLNHKSQTPDPYTIEQMKILMEQVAGSDLELIVVLGHWKLSTTRFHDLRHSAATNMHRLTGDFYTVGQILGHSLKGIGIQLDISATFHAVTATYVDVRLARKNLVLESYHNAVLTK